MSAICRCLLIRHKFGSEIRKAAQDLSSGRGTGSHGGRPPGWGVPVGEHGLHLRMRWTGFEGKQLRLHRHLLFSVPVADVSLQS